MSKKDLHMSQDCGEELKTGDVVTLYNNTYKVMSPRGADQIILQDSKNLMFAMPVKKFNFLRKKNLVQIMYKSATAQFVAEFKQKKQEEVLKAKNAPVHTIMGDRIKVRETPAKWVHVSTGQSYDSHDSDEAHPELHHHADSKEALKLHRNVMLRTHPEDHDNLKKLANKFFGKQRSFHNLREAHEALRDKEGFAQTLDNLNIDATKTWKEFKSAYKASVTRVKSRGRKHG